MKAGSIRAAAFLATFVGTALTCDANAAPEKEIGHGGKREKVEALKRLKRENPEAFERVVAARKERLKAKLEEIRESDPEKFAKIKEKIRRGRRGG